MHLVLDSNKGKKETKKRNILHQATLAIKRGKNRSLFWPVYVRKIRLCGFGYSRNSRIDCSEMKENDKWPFYDHSSHFFGNYMTIFHKTEVQTVILRC